MAATTPPSIRAAVERGYHLMTGTGAVLEELEQRSAYIDSVLEGLGRSSDGVERAVNRFIICTTSESDIDGAIDAARWQIRASRSLTGGTRPVRGANAAQPYQGEPDRDTWRRRMIAGNPDECLAQMQQLADAGITYTFGIFDPGGLDQEITMRSLKLFTEEVVPALPSIKAVHADPEQRAARMNSFLTDGPKYVGV
jgi:alkanesulfonate monooxygenase SsuD/methylene tetrahydromethanopterin reductase-like flavin-dependent oxidoreductase (luciferase family)